MSVSDCLDALSDSDGATPELVLGELEGELDADVDNDTPCITFAYFPTYSMERQLDLVHRLQATPGVRHAVLGK